MNYQESSIDDDSDGQILFDHENKENWQPSRWPNRRVSRYGPSSARIAAQSSKPSDTDNATGRASPALSSSSSGSSRTAPGDVSPSQSVHKDDGYDAKPDPTLATAPKRKSKGTLNIKTVGLKKPKHNRVLSCAKCEYSGASTKLLNKDHIDQHELSTVTLVANNAAHCLHWNVISTNMWTENKYVLTAVRSFS